MRLQFGVFVAALSLLCPALAFGGDAPTDREKLIEELIVKAANIQPGDVVQIDGPSSQQGLMEDIAVAVHKHGAFSVMTMSYSADFGRRYYSEVPARYDIKASSGHGDLTRVIDVAVVLNVPDAQWQALFPELPAERLQSVQKSWATVMQASAKNGVRTVYLGNRIFPCEENAKEYGLEESQLETLFWNGLAADYDAIEARGAAMRTALQGGKKLHVTDPNGTDLTLKIARRDVHVSDGVISDADIKEGGNQLRVYLPAGEVILMPVPGTAKGTAVFDRVGFGTEEIRNLRLVFKKGKVVSMKADDTLGYRNFRKFYDAAGKGKDHFAAINFGINPEIQIPEGSRLKTWMPAGMVTLTIGGDAWLGGDNAAGFTQDGFLTHATVTLDGDELVKDGKLLVPGAGSR